MFTKFTVCFIPQVANLKFQVFGPFVEKKYAESFIKADIEYGKNLASEKGWGMVGLLFGPIMKATKVRFFPVMVSGRLCL